MTVTCRRFAAAVLAIGFLVASGTGCGGATKQTKTVTPRPLSVHKSVFIDDLRLEMAALKRTFPRDEIIPLRLSITNTGTKPHALTFPSAQTHDFTIADKSDKVVWRWSDGRAFAQTFSTRNLEPGAAGTLNFFGAVKAGALPPGEYTVSGWLTAQELFGEKISLTIAVR